MACRLTLLRLTRRRLTAMWRFTRRRTPRRFTMRRLTARLTRGLTHLRQRQTRPSGRPLAGRDFVSMDISFFRAYCFSW